MGLTQDLLHLFHIDGQVRGLRNRLDAAQRYLLAQQQRLDELDQQRRELQTRQRHIEATIGTLEVETKSLDERLEKLRGELNSATTNKQYSAILTELNTAKAARGELEDRILEEMERIEHNRGELARLAEETAERGKVRGVAEHQLQERQQEIGSRLAELEAQRDEAASGIPGAELIVFNDMADTYDGEAMAPIEEIDRRHREYACGACNISLPFEAVAALMSSDRALVRCTACGRILYLQDETRGALTRK